MTKKHLLVVKSTDKAQKATERKDDISGVLDGLQVVDARFQPTGKVILNFKTEEQRNRAAEKVGDLNNLAATKKKKLLPKIMICNVNTLEDKDTLVEEIIERNNYLEAIEDIEDKISLVFDKDAAGGTKHYILKCHPEVRGLIYKKGDQINLKWGVYKVRNRYFATMCYHCLKYGHVLGKCPDKEKDPCCRKCAGAHSVGSCSSTEKKCINCVRASKSDQNHSANETCCPMLNAEIANIQSNTDHGY